MIIDRDNAILVVGAGISGAVISRQLAEQGYRVNVIDVREHLAGNCYDYLDEHGILIHKFGPHLFHTSNQSVIEYLSRFTNWVDYQHKVKALLPDGQYVTLPVNRRTAEIVGKENVIKIFFEPYTKKMWGLSIEEINPDILNRVRIRDDDNERYFPNDTFQKLPKYGYTKMIENMLDHPNIYLSLNTVFDKAFEKEFKHIFNSMPIDEYFDYSYGTLPYRSIKFYNCVVPVPKLLPVATVNFTHAGPYTRVTEWKNLPNNPISASNQYITVLTIEEPCDYQDNNFSRFYPIEDANGVNYSLYKKYHDLTPPYMTFIGRCGTYRYFDMDDAVAESLRVSSNFLFNHS